MHAQSTMYAHSIIWLWMQNTFQKVSLYGITTHSHIKYYVHKQKNKIHKLN